VCSVCGGGFTLASTKGVLECNSRTQKGTCTNDRRIKREELERRVLVALTTNFFANPAALKAFAEEFTTTTNRLRMEQRASLSGAKRDLERTRREIEKIIDAIVGGYAGPELKDRMAVLQATKDALIAQLAATDEPAPLLHPGMAATYEKHITRLVESLASGEDGGSAAREAVRNLIAKIVIPPEGKLQVVGIVGEMLSLAGGKSGQGSCGGGI
jgi:site-specific DNA recombinase